MKITETQTAALTAAAARPDGAILPLPAHIRGGAIGKVCDALVAKGLATSVGLPGKQTRLELTKFGVATPSGGRWHPQTVMRVLSRADLT